MNFLCKAVMIYNKKMMSSGVASVQCSDHAIIFMSTALVIELVEIMYLDEALPSN